MSQYRNRAERIQRNYLTRIRRHQNNVNQTDSPKWDIVTIHNLSSSGILFNYNQKLPLNTILEFKISLPFERGLHCLGVVRRIETASSITAHKDLILYKIAAYFVDLDDHTKLLIENLAQKLKP